MDLKKTEKRKMYDKEHNFSRTKTNTIAKINKIYEENENTILIKRNKRRVNMSINEGVLRLIECSYENKSKLIEDLLIKHLEKTLNKKIIITNYEEKINK